ncbi:MAG TPA: hypothetical protein VN734_14485 [Acidobacteriaceae bacterium]|nr:hypothetical protein [Acidobacteriaceae bacterium]
MTLKRRIEKLEKALKADPILLHFADGSTRVLNGRRGMLLNLLEAAMSGNVRSEEKVQLDLISQSVASTEPDGARLCELLRVYVQGPIARVAKV